MATFENTHKKRVDHFPEVSFGPFKPVCLDSHDNLAVHKSVQYGQDRMKIEGGGGPGGGGVAYPRVMEKICKVDF